MNRDKKVRTECDRAGFTLIELLVVIAIIGALAGLSVAGVIMVRQASLTRQAHAEAVQIANAMEQYRQDFGQWPTQEQEKEDKTYDQTAELKPIYDILTGNNAKGRQYISIPEQSLKGGVYVDPWERPYVIACDEKTDVNSSNPYEPSKNNIVAVDPDTSASLQTSVVQKVAVFSWGRDPQSERPKPATW